MTKKTIGHAPCPLCKSGPHPVKVSDSGNLYMVCPPPADGGCQNQFFARHAHSNRLLAQSITKWSIPKEERKTWLGTEEVEDAPDEPDEPEVQEQLEEAIEDGEIQVVETPPQPSPRKSASRMVAPSSPPTPPPAKSRPARKPPARKPAAKQAGGVKMPWEW